MIDERIRLTEPTERLQDAFLDFAMECHVAGETDIISSDDIADFGAYIQRLRDIAQGRNLPDGFVPGSEYWLMQGLRMVGRCSLRYELTDALRDFGGHVGYAVRPSARGHGYATLMLNMMLDEARRRGIDHVLLTCASDNIASARVIEKCGGMLDDVSYSPRAGRFTRRYWITVRLPSGIRTQPYAVVG